MDSHTMLLMVGLIICLGIATYVLADRLSVPSIVLLLGVGIIAGPEVLGLIDPAEFGSGIRVLVPLLVAIIVFEGGIVLDINILRQISRPVQMLMSVGALITWGAATLVAHYVAGLQLPTAILFGALMSVTGPTVITPLMRRTNARERLKVLLQAEGVLVDAVGAILAVVVLNVIISQGT
nr:cation:proton antiporter [Herpetosiphon sp.]